MVKWCELIVALIVLVFSFWRVAYSDWIIIIAAVVLLVHSFMNCKCCGYCEHGEMSMKSPASKKKRR